MKLLNADPCFCMKTFLKSKKDKNFQTKLFINICETKELQKPTFEEKIEKGEKGQSWRLPYITNKPRYDQDKSIKKKMKL